MNLTWDKEDLKQLVQEYRSKRYTLKATFDSNNLWEAHITSSNSQIINLAKDAFFANRVSNSLDRIGVTELNIIEVETKAIDKTTKDGWIQRFLVNATLDFPEVKMVPDTNFIMRSYASGFLRRLGKENFGQLHFSIPALVILEIEAIYNRAKKTSESLLEHAKCSKLKSNEEQELTKAKFEAKEALVATKELMFLREQGADIIESNLEGAIHNFSGISGRGFSDMYIRKQIRDTMKARGLKARFLTCDLMNALSAVAEGLPTFYFSRIPSEKLWFSDKFDTCMEQVSDLILDTAVTFGEFTFTAWSSDKLEDSRILKGKWDGWTIEDLLNDRLIEERQE